MRIERTHDIDLVTRIMSDPAVYPQISDDGSPDIEDFIAVDDDAIYYLLVLDNSENVLGLFLLHPHNTVLYEIHTCLLSTCRGAQADEAAQKVLDWIFNNTPCKKLMTYVPETNKPALHYAQRAGLKIEGINTQSFLKDGELYDQTFLGITRTG